MTALMAVTWASFAVRAYTSGGWKAVFGSKVAEEPSTAATTSDPAKKDKPRVAATGPARVYKAGESFFEPAGSEHLISENASAVEPASLLAVFVADDGAQLTIFDK